MATLHSVCLLVLCAVLQVALSRARDAHNNVGIIGGHKIGIKSAPYMAGLFDNGDLVCGGSIIHKQFVLTTADCLRDANLNEVHIGAQHVEQEGYYIDVDKVYCHDDFNPESYNNDICLIKLRQRIRKFNRKIAKIQLADETFVIEEGTMVNLTGWGSMTADVDGKFPRFLRQTTVPVVSEEWCRKIEPDMTDNMFCAGAPGRDACAGDAGGPVTLNNVQIGIVSFGGDCGTEPGFNTKVSKYFNWIQTTIRNHL